MCWVGGAVEPLHCVDNSYNITELIIMWQQLQTCSGSNYQTRLMLFNTCVGESVNIQVSPLSFFWSLNHDNSSENMAAVFSY